MRGVIGYSLGTEIIKICICIRYTMCMELEVDMDVLTVEFCILWIIRGRSRGGIDSYWSRQDVEAYMHNTRR